MTDLPKATPDPIAEEVRTRERFADLIAPLSAYRRSDLWWMLNPLLENQSALKAENARLRADVARLREALEPFAKFARQWDRKPMSQIADTFYAIHTGTEWEASLSLTACRHARDALLATQRETP